MKTNDEILDQLTSCTIEEDADLDVKENFYYKYEDVIKAMNEARKQANGADTGANAMNILLRAGAYLGSLVGKEVSVEPGFIYEMRGFQLNENGSGTLYGKNGFCTFWNYKVISPCR